VTASAVEFENKMIRVKRDTIALPGGDQIECAFVEKGPAVIVVPVTSDGRMVLVRQYRHPVAEYCLEVPAGTARDTQGLSLEEVAAKELREEVGATFERIEHLGSFYSNSSLCDEGCHVFLALGIRLDKAPEREPAEAIETLAVGVPEAVSLARRGGMKTGPAALAVLMAEPRLRELALL
jgi:ADP-ribose pyrophosphatase